MENKEINSRIQKVIEDNARKVMTFHELSTSF